MLPSTMLEESFSPRQNPQDGAALAKVTLHIYHVTDMTTVQRVNKVLKSAGTGAFHAGVEVYGKEWSYGFTEGGSGLFGCEPGECEAHSYIQAMPVGSTALSEKEVRDLLRELAAEWQGDDYDLLRCNCCHFSAHLLRRLGAGPVPRWVTNLAGHCAAVDDTLHTATELRRTVKSGASMAASKARFGADYALSTITNRTESMAAQGGKDPDAECRRSSSTGVAGLKLPKALGASMLVGTAAKAKERACGVQDRARAALHSVYLGGNLRGNSYEECY